MNTKNWESFQDRMLFLDDKFAMPSADLESFHDNCKLVSKTYANVQDIFNFLCV